MVNLTLIHGFTQDASVWQETVSSLPRDWQITTLDLPGHGSNGQLKTSNPLQFLDQTEALVPASEPADDNILCGYSMGGRVALQLAARSQERWTNVVVVSSGAGISDRSARRNRKQADELIASQLDRGSIKEFAAHWDGLDLWEGDPEQARAARRAMILRQNTAGLAAALRSFGQGIAPVFAGFASATGPNLTVIRGERDTAYTAATAGLARLGATAPTVIPGGHSLPLESPDHLARLISSI